MFRPAIAPVFWCVFIFVSVFGNLFGLVLVAHDDGWRVALRFLPLAALAGVVIALLWAFLWAVLLHFFFPTRLSPDGVSAYSFLGVWRFIAWRHIGLVRPIRIFNLCYLHLYSTTDRKVTWLPLFPAEPDVFRRALQSAMPPDSPILTHIR